LLTLEAIVAELDFILDPDDDMGFISASEIGMLRDQLAAMAGRGFTITRPTGRRSARTQTPSGRRSSTKKRKPSAYQMWAKKERPRIVKQHPRFSFGRINQELGKRWKRSKQNPKNKKGGKR
jgi:hypothetical protein